MLRDEHTQTQVVTACTWKYPDAPQSNLTKEVQRASDKKRESERARARDHPVKGREGCTLPEDILTHL